MSKSARSVFIFSIYLFGLSIILMVIPNVLLGIFKFPETKEVWVRVVGVLVFVIAFYYFKVSKSEMKAFFLWTVYGRSAVLIFFIVFVILGFASPALILFGLIDAFAAFWTYKCLQSEKLQK